MKRWVDTWKYITGPELERIKREELRSMTDEKVLQQMESVMNSGADEIWIDPGRRESSGLVEQQRWFLKFRSAPK